MTPDSIHEEIEKDEKASAVISLHSMMTFDQGAESRGDDSDRDKELKDTAQAYLQSQIDASVPKLDKDSERMAKTYLRDLVRNYSPETNPSVGQEELKKVRNFVQKL